MSEVEEQKKRKRAKDQCEEIIEHNAKLASFIHRMEFLLLENTKKYYRTKVAFKNYIAQLALALDRAGFTVPALPMKVSEHEDALDLDLILREIEFKKKMQEDLDSKKKKMGRPKKEAKTETAGQ